MNTIKNIIITILLSVTIFGCENKHCNTTSCTETPIRDYWATDSCSDSLCEKYQTIWKEIFIKKNGLTEEYFNNHIRVRNPHIYGTTFMIHYTVTIDWAVVHCWDSFIIKIDEDSTSYPHLLLPRDVFLTKEDIEIIIEAKAFSPRFSNLTSDNRLKFSSLDDAKKLLTKQANVNTLCLVYGSEFYINDDGHITMNTSAEYDCNLNVCIYARLDLINGKATFHDDVCWK